MCAGAHAHTRSHEISLVPRFRWAVKPRLLTAHTGGSAVKACLALLGFFQVLPPQLPPGQALEEQN